MVESIQPDGTNWLSVYQFLNGNHYEKHLGSRKAKSTNFQVVRKIYHVAL